MIDIKKIYADVLTGKENLNASEIQVCCPFHEDKNPSMSINTETGVYYCHGCGETGSPTWYYMKRKGLTYPQALEELELDNNSYYGTKPKPKAKEQTIIDYTSYFSECFDRMLNNYQLYGKRLYKLRGLTFLTATACSIGVDINENWIFPVYKFPDMQKIVGYEVRKSDFTKFSSGNKCFKADKTPSCLAIVRSGFENKKCYICEGFIDSCFLYQHLQDDNIWILTPSNGVHTIPNLVKEQLPFDEVIFCLDNDKAGNETTEIIKKMNYPNYHFFTGLKGGEDIELYVKRVSAENS